VRFFTAHLRAGREPELLQEGFCWGAFVFGPLWLAAHRAWIAAILVGVIDAGIALSASGVRGLALTVWAAWLTGVFGQDMRRWTLMHRGYDELHVIAARDETAAFGRLLAARPDLAAQAGARL
jgi:hypothetical protein